MSSNLFHYTLPKALNKISKALRDCTKYVKKTRYKIFPKNEKLVWIRYI